MGQSAAIYLGLRYSRAKHGSKFTRFINRFAFAGIVVGVAALIVVSSVMNGFEQQLKQRILGVVPQLTVSSANTAGISATDTFIRQLPALPGERAKVPQVSSAGVVQSGGQLRPVLIQGLFPEVAGAAVQWQPLQQHLQFGEIERLQAGGYGVLIGQALAQQLDVWPGDSIRVIAAAGGVYTPLGLMPAQRQFTIVGIVAMQSEADGQLLVMHGSDAARLLRLPDSQVSNVRYYFTDPFQAISAAEYLQQQLGPDFNVRSWRSQYGELFDAVNMEKRMVGLMLGLIIAVAAFNIVSALMMLIQDKQTDIAILQTMGMRKSGIYQMFLMQGLTNGVIGSLLGLTAGVLLAGNLNQVLSLLQVDLSFTGQAGLPVLMQPEQIVTIVLAALLLTLLATLYPAWRASQTQPARALTYE
ncbi:MULTISPECIES: lipoprotein-releasing ABC transporter permease subunit [Idiomarina]|uniref:lipoprotein-releasing ABC transporter permease subunit n=1 Tax=Idiomarina TaxID=135575 RepID=UPI00129ABC98|nr:MULTISPECIES: lipoprotein-releasing ABC transporter permease subunit [Idiomarina]MRJ41354.1 lipoprotein-releasing ABC transporter permease subunit [Idiomarina sp. FeN1]NCU56829.1 lipoprotein-releasing ABC transporter permease subunit [Idiomarina sp. FenA--70]NCU59538.1 lipoprotein-releasing ABC transporter permease subunit [Idiomarina sp. FenBw--71]UUN14194.1 lipoprotein-releasing ABC transporter permease subunit [Idiomarina loihiensis]